MLSSALLKAELDELLLLLLLLQLLLLPLLLRASPRVRVTRAGIVPELGADSDADDDGGDGPVASCS